MITRERRDGGEARGNEEREKRENSEREERKRQKGIEITPLVSACCSSSSRHCSTPPNTSSQPDSAVKHCSSEVLVSTRAAW